MKNLKALLVIIAMVFLMIGCLTVENNTSLSVSVKTDKGNFNCHVGLVIGGGQVDASTVCSGVLHTDRGDYLCKNVSIDYAKSGNVLKTEQACEIVAE